MKKFSILLCLFLFFSLNVFAAEIQGTVYDFDLDIIKNSRVEINTEPKQMFVAKEGKYFFNVPEGEFIIHATYDDLESVENITISTKGLFTLDLILLPVLDEEFLDENYLNFDEDYDIYFEYDKKSVNTNKKKFLFIVFSLIIFSFFVLVAILFHFKKKKKKERKKIFRNDADNLIDFLKKEGGRALQKDIRKQFAVSEAKISLLIDELVSKGKVEKFKKGRGNIIILKK